MAAAAAILLSVFLLFVFASNADGKLGGLKLCAVGDPKVKSTRTTKYCDLLGKSKRTPVTCVYAADRLGCLLAVSARKADFSVFEAEDLYFSTLWEESAVLVVSEIRALRSKAFRYGAVAMVRKDSNVTGVGDLRGRRLCHPGSENGPDWTRLAAQYFEERVAPADCEEGLSVYEDRIKTTSGYFASACKAGPWSPNEEEDARLKNKYWNLCALCDGADCGSADKYRGSGGSIVCFKDGAGEILWTRQEDVKAHMKFLVGDSSEAASKYEYLCENGSLMPLTSEEPCVWLAQPWQVVGAHRKSAIDVQKAMDLLSDDEHNEWEENLGHVIELYLEYVHNLLVSRTPEDYLRTIPGYLSASAMSQGNCKPRRSVKFCVASPIEEKKCDWISKAGSAFGIQPALECLQKPNFTSCLDSVAKKETDVVSVPPDFFYDAAVKFNLRNFLVEAGTQFSDNYLSCVVVRKKSGWRKLTDLKGKKICVTREGGVGWWSLHAALHRQSLVRSFCDGPAAFFGEVRAVVDGGGCPGGAPASTSAPEDAEAEALRCLLEGSCDAAVVNCGALGENSGGENLVASSKTFKSSDLEPICESPEGTVGCHLVWSPPHYLMTAEEPSSSKGGEIYNVFFELGQHFGRDSRKSDAMLEIFGSFHDIKNVLFRDTSASFIPLNKWNQSNSFQDTLNQMRGCSKSPPPLRPLLLTVVCTCIFSALHL